MTERKVFWSTVLAGAVFLMISSATLISPASAGTPGIARQQVVDYGDLNLADPRGVARLHARILQAAVSVCGSPDGFYLRIRQLRRDCIEQAVESAVRQIDHPGLKAYHATRSHPVRLVQAPLR